MCHRGGVKLSRFDYMNFTDGSWDFEFVAHAKKFSKIETLNLFMIENEHLFSEGCRKPTIDDVKEATVRWYPIAPDDCDLEGGCYSYCKRNERGSFPVWIIEFEKLKF